MKYAEAVPVLPTVYKIILLFWQKIRPLGKKFVILKLRWDIQWFYNNLSNERRWYCLHHEGNTTTTVFSVRNGNKITGTALVE